MLKVELIVFQIAAPGDIISFTFNSNYSVTQSSLEAPCTPQAGGLDTGLCVLSIQFFYTLYVFF